MALSHVDYALPTTLKIGYLTIHRIDLGAWGVEKGRGFCRQYGCRRTLWQTPSAHSIAGSRLAFASRKRKCRGGWQLGYCFEKPACEERRERRVSASHWRSLRRDRRCPALPRRRCRHRSGRSAAGHGQPGGCEPCGCRGCAAGDRYLGCRGEASEAGEGPAREVTVIASHLGLPPVL